MTVSVSPLLRPFIIKTTIANYNVECIIPVYVYCLLGIEISYYVMFLSKEIVCICYCFRDIRARNFYLSRQRYTTLSPYYYDADLNIFL